jgi:hypothetical protein
MVCLVYLVCFVCLVALVSSAIEPNKLKKLNQPDKHAFSFHADGGSHQGTGERAEGGYHGAVVTDYAPVHDSAIRGGH